MYYLCEDLTVKREFMWGAISQWLLENIPTLFVIILVAIIVWLLAKVYYTRIKKAEDKLKVVAKKVSKLPCAAHEDTYNKINDNLNLIIKYLKKQDSNAAFLFSLKESPRKLNDNGKLLFENCGGGEFLIQHKGELLDAIAAKEPKTALDVEEIANDVLIERLESDIFNDIKQWVYNSPYWTISVDGEDKKYAITMNDICFVLSLPLRDMYLEAHPDLE